MKLVFALIVATAVAAANELGDSVQSAAVQSAGRAAGQIDALSGRSIREPAPAPKQGVTPAHKGGNEKKKAGANKAKKSGKGKGAKSGKGAKKKSKGQKKGKSAAHANKKKAKNGGKKKSKHAKKAKAAKKKSAAKGSKKVKGAARQSTTCGVADVVAAIKKFTLYTTNLNQNKRIRGFMSLAQTKMNKAPTTFAQTASVISDATGGGGNCNGGTANNTVSTLYSKLTNCGQTAAAACNMTLSAADNATVTSCAASLENYTKAFQACVASGSCACFQSLVSLPACENMTTILGPVTTAKNKCVGTSTSGSFADCRQQQIAAIPFTSGCKCPGPQNFNVTLTTKPVGRLFRNREFFKFNKINL